MWEQARAFLAAQPGYISTQLHQAVSPDAHYLLINVANWESIETFQAAIAALQQQAALPKIAGVIPAPQLYKVIRKQARPSVCAALPPVLENGRY